MSPTQPFFWTTTKKLTDKRNKENRFVERITVFSRDTRRVTTSNNGVETTEADTLDYFTQSRMDLGNLNTANNDDPFGKAGDTNRDHTKIHIRVQQRNGRKCITTIQGLADDLDVKKIARALKKTFQCNGSVTNDVELGEILQLSGDQRSNVRDFFVDMEICYEDQIVVHGG